MIKVMSKQTLKFNIVFCLYLLVIVYITAGVIDSTMTFAEFLTSVFGYVSFSITGVMAFLVVVLFEDKHD